METLPAGFTYKSSTLSSAAVNVGDDSLRFTLLGGDSLSYILIAGEPGDYTFSGTIENLDNESADITGDDSVTVNPAGSTAATRSFESAGVAVGGAAKVTVTVSNYGGGGKLVETLPEGFTFVSTSLGDGSASVDGQNVTFYLLGDDSVSYVASAPRRRRRRRCIHLQRYAHGHRQDERGRGRRKQTCSSASSTQPSQMMSRASARSTRIPPLMSASATRLWRPRQSVTSPSRSPAPPLTPSTSKTMVSFAPRAPWTTRPARVTPSK